jgi:hypothetical protein
MHKGSLFFLMMFTIFILLPIAGSTVLFLKGLIKLLFSGKRETNDERKCFIKIILTVGIIYGFLLEGYLFWMSWISKFDIPQVMKLLGLFASLPYLMLLFGVVYSIGPAVAFGGGSTMKIFNHIVGKDNKGG